MSEIRTLTLNGKQYDCFVDSVARSMVEATALIDSAVGENIVVKNASNYDLAGLRIFGKTTQDGTPTPEAPVELESLGGSGSITVTVTGERESHKAVIPTPNGLPGIPVTSGGNYTDANGQRWVCDEIDFSRGVYVRRVKKYTVDGSNDEYWAKSALQEVVGATRFDLTVETEPQAGRKFCLCNAYIGADYANRYAESCWCNDETTIYGLQFRICTAYATTVEGLKERLRAMPVNFIYQLATPIETPLSEEELAAYSALHTYRDSTTVSNDAGAYMELEYVMDAKKYIDSLLKASGWIANVSLPAAGWKGTKSPWYQVVQIPGVTENSQVDLTPDVTQLAIFHDKDLAFVAENEEGVVTVYAVGQKPTNDYVIQATIKEVL